MYFLKKIITIAVIAGALYMLLGYHYIYINKSVKLLKKSEYNLKYTFFSTQSRSIESILSIPELWNDGIGNLLVKEGMISRDDLAMYRSRIYGGDE